MLLRRICLFVVLFFSLQGNCQFNGKEIFHIKLKEELNTFEKKFEILMSDKATISQAKRARDYIINKFDKDAIIETVDSYGNKREHSVQDYFTNIRSGYLYKYPDYWDVELELILPEEDDINKRIDGTYTAEIRIKQIFIGQSGNRLFKDVTAKIILVETYKTYDSVSKRTNPYNIKFMGLKAEGRAHQTIETIEKVKN